VESVEFLGKSEAVSEGGLEKKNGGMIIHFKREKQREGALGWQKQSRCRERRGTRGKLGWRG